MSGGKHDSKLEEKLRHAAEEMYRSLFENANDAIITTDLEERVTSWNRSAEIIFGWQMHEVIGKNITELSVPPDLYGDSSKIIRDIMSGRDVKVVEALRFRKDGSKLSVSLSISPIKDPDHNIIGALTIISDITEHKRTEETLKLFSSAVENAPDGIQIIGLDGCILYSNSAIEKIYGFSHEEHKGKHVNEMNLDPEFASRVILPSIRETGRWAGELMVRHRNGGAFPILLTTSMVKDGRGEPLAMVGIIRDITERKKAEEQLKISLKEKEILLQEIHHRVKNNIQVISSLLNLQADLIPEEKYRNMFRESRNRIYSMSLIHEKLYQSGDLAKIDFNDYVKDLVYDLFEYYGANTGNIELNINVENVLLGIESAIPCGLVINELVTNSLKYAFPDGRKGELKISFRASNENMVELIIRDNGIGIPENLDFRNTQSMGLHLVTMLVENQLRGEINLDRSNGTEFRIEFKGEK